MDFKEIPDNIYILSMLRLICYKLNITETDIYKTAKEIHGTIKGDKE